MRPLHGPCPPRPMKQGGDHGTRRSLSLFTFSSDEFPSGSSKILFYFEILNNTECKKGFTIEKSPRVPKETSEMDQCAGDCSRNPTSISIYTLREDPLYRKAYNLSMRLVGLCGSMRDGTDVLA